MKVITWNVNSIRLRSSLIYRLLEIEKPDILCLQECKSLTEQMPLDLFESLGYLFSASWGQKVIMVLRLYPKFHLKNRKN